MLIALLTIFVVGLFFGSFLNLVVDRLQVGKGIFSGRSHCDSCKKALGASDLIPLLSFALVRGQCRYCHTKLSYYYPISELITGAGFVAMAVYSGFGGWLQSYLSFSGAGDAGAGVQNLSLGVWFLYLLVILSFYIIMFLSDLKYRILPNAVVFPAILVVALMLLSNLVYSLWSSYSTLAADTFGKYLIQAGFWQNQLVTSLSQVSYTLISAFVIYAFFWGLVYFTKGRGMGGGDVKLAFLIGLFNGFPYNILAIFLGFLFGATFSVVLIALGKKGMKSTIAFGPFLILGSLAALFFGKLILRVYLGVF